MNDSTLSLSKGGVSHNVQSIIDFLSSVNYEERIDIASKCCADRQKHFFNNFDSM